MMVVVLGTAAIVTIIVVVGLLLDRKVAILPRAEAAAPARREELPVPGATAHTAVKVPRSWRPRLAAGRCTCGKPLAVASDEAITLAGRPLVVVRLACVACGHARSVYLEPALA
jgi:hypothetical protein